MTVFFGSDGIFSALAVYFREKNSVTFRDGIKKIRSEGMEMTVFFLSKVCVTVFFLK